MMINYRVYSNKLIKDYSKEIGSISMKDVEYKATVVYKEELDYQSDEARQVIGRLVKRFMQCIKLVKYGRKYFNPNKRFDFAQHELSLMQGYDSAITIKGERILL